jgi:hypothetical protein
MTRSPVTLAAMRKLAHLWKQVASFELAKVWVPAHGCRYKRQVWSANVA